MTEWKKYRKHATTDIRPYEVGEDLTNVSVDKGYTPKAGDMIATDHKTVWLMTKEFFEANYVSAQ